MAEGTQMNNPTRNLRVLYVQPKTSCYAGIERVVDEVAAALAEILPHRFDVSVLYLSRFEGYELGERPYTPIFTAPTGVLSTLATLRRVIGRGQYDVVVFPQIEPTVMGWIATLGLKSRLICHLHGNPRRENSHWKAKVMFRIMRLAALRDLACVYGTSPKQLDDFNQMFPSSVARRWVPNPVRRFPTSAAEPRPEGTVTFVNVGRFAYQKGQDALIKAFAKVHDQRPHTRLKLVGYGSDREHLATLVAGYGLEDSVQFEHRPHDPQVALLSSDVYVSSSRWEGWSLAICEALRCGLPVVATDCPFGPSDILTDPRLGHLVPPNDSNALAAAMLEACDKRAENAAHAQFRRDYIDQFSVERVVHVHGEALQLAAQHQARTWRARLAPSAPKRNTPRRSSHG